MDIFSFQWAIVSNYSTLSVISCCVCDMLQKEDRDTSQVDIATPRNIHGFDITLQNHQNAKTLQKVSEFMLHVF